MLTPILAVIAALLLMALFVLPSFWRLVRWEIAWDWRIAMFGWHAFLLGLFLGAVTALALAWHFGVRFIH